jgi:hypothetical protein
MDQNEKDFVKTVVDLESNVIKAIKYVSENFNVEVDYDSDEFTLNIINDIFENKSNNNDLNLLKAKQYLSEQFKDVLTVEIV